MFKQSLLLVGVSSTILLAACFSEKATPEQMASYVNQCPADFFDKSASIFEGISICANKDVSQDKLKHAANVTAQWLDNNQDGKVDYLPLMNILKKDKPVIVMSGNGFSMLESDTIFTNLGDRPGQDLSAAETNPTGDRRDASQEEIHHIIMNAGWIKLFPKIFSDQKTQQSKLYKTWKFADDNGHYQYNDPTCNDACKVTEFVYLASAAYLGSDADLQSDEMMLKDRAQLKETVPDMIDIFESKDYDFPTSMWPNGDYQHTQNIQYFSK